MLDDRIKIRRAIQIAGKSFYESICQRNLQNIAGELMAKNEDWVLNHPDTVGSEIILSKGFTDNQLRWLKNLKELIEPEECPKCGNPAGYTNNYCCICGYRHKPEVNSRTVVSGDSSHR